MKNSDLIKAQNLILDAANEIKGKGILDIKYKALHRIKGVLWEALMLMDAQPNELKQCDIIPAKDIIKFFDDNYPKWKVMRRQRAYVIPRQILQCLLAVRSELTLSEIGAKTCGYDHTTVIHSRDTIIDMIDTEDKRYIPIYNHAISYLEQSTTVSDLKEKVV